MPPPRRPAGRAPRLPPPPEQYTPLRFPQAGLDLSQPYGLPRVRTTPVGLNVRLHEGLTLRGRGGSRAGLGKFVPAALPSGALIQDLNVVVDPAGVALLANYDFNPADLYDPSSFGPATSWGVGPLGTDGLPIPGFPIDSRNPGWVLRVGGTGVQPNKNDRRGVWISWPAPAAITVGTALSGAQLDAQATDPRTLLPLTGGTYVYNPPAGTVLASGAAQVLQVTYTPDDTVHYKGGTATVTLDVNRLVPVIAWPSPARIAPGTPLSATQLNATATDPNTSAPVPGTFRYTPGLGTVLPAGTSTLSVTFTPSDTNTYSSPTATVSIAVGSGVAWVQGALDTNFDSGTNPRTLAFATTVARGDTILVLVHTFFSADAGGTVTVSDSQHNAYAQLGSYQRVSAASAPDGYNHAVSLWGAPAAVSAACTVTVTASAGFDGGIDSVKLAVAEYTAASLDGSHGQAVTAPTGTAWSTGTIPVNGAGRLLLGAFGPQTYFGLAADSGFTIRLGDPTQFDSLLLLEKTATTGVSGPVTATYTPGAPDRAIYMALGVSLF